MKTLIVLDFESGKAFTLTGVEHMSESDIEEFVTQEFSSSTQYMVQEGCDMTVMDIKQWNG
jgi:hypothetical protein